MKVRIALLRAGATRQPKRQRRHDFRWLFFDVNTSRILSFSTLFSLFLSLPFLFPLPFFLFLPARPLGAARFPRAQPRPGSFRATIRRARRQPSKTFSKHLARRRGGAAARRRRCGTPGVLLNKPALRFPRHGATIHIVSIARPTPRIRAAHREIGCGLVAPSTPAQRPKGQSGTGRARRKAGRRRGAHRQRCPAG